MASKTPVEEFHSMIRWSKPIAQIEVSRAHFCVIINRYVLSVVILFCPNTVEIASGTTGVDL
jgi:hypothetical protein